MRIWGGKTVKRVFLLTLLLLFALVLCACKSQKELIQLTDADMVYIDMVYDNIDSWDVSINNSNQDWTIDKVAFFDFDGNDNICFYTLYPVTDVYGRGFFVDGESMSQMKFSVYDTDEKSRSMGWIAQTRANGTDWNSNASSEEKYQTLKDAYLYFKEHNIYK